eukprot:3300856-Karenia_brevis.AAC.1
MDTFTAWVTWMHDPQHLNYLDEQPSSPGITWMDNLRCLRYLDGGSSLPGLLLVAWTTWKGNL